MSGISVLTIAKDGLLSHQTAINLTGTNVTNASTENYSRQRAVFSTTLESVQITGIERIYDQFLGVQINEQTNNLGYSQAREDALKEIEMIFNETNGGGINQLLSEFWSAWGDLSANPSGEAERLTLVSTAESLTSLFRSYGDDLLSAQNDANDRVARLVDDANDIVADIVDTNEKIMQYGTGATDDTSLNALRDTQDALLSSLAEIVDFHYTRNDDGSVSVFLSNGLPLVDGTQSWELDVVADSETSFYNVVFTDDPTQELNSVLTGGSLAAYLEIRDTTVVGYMDSLDTLAATLASEVNTQHGLGYDLNRDAGGAFFYFDADPGVEEARYLRVSDEIVSDTDKIAASSTVNGDGENATTISMLQDELTMSGGTSTFGSYYSALVGQVGQDTAYASSSSTRNSDLLTQLTDKRDEVSGVSIDEEMINLIKFQTGYNASARLVAAAEELSGTLMSLVG